MNSDGLGIKYFRLGAGPIVFAILAMANKLLDSRDITGGDGIDITRNVDESVTISTGGFGLKVVDGLLCAVYAVEDEG